MKDGHLNKCKECAKRDVRLHRRENESVRDYDKRRYHENAERRKRTAENAKKWNQKNPQGYKAHYLVSNAIRDNRLKKEPCARCGEKKVHAHHEDYNKPLDVVWLCVKCHQRHHHGDKAF